MLTYTAEDFKQLINKNEIDIKKIQNTLVSTLAKKNLKIAVAESCTGGLISQKITEVSGASAVYECGVCSYGNNIKEKLLNVKVKTLKDFGAVSPQTAKEMALGVRQLAESDIAITTTGVAGPTGGTKEKPVGLVYIGLSTKEKTIAVKALLAKDNRTTRENVREMAAVLALYIALCEIKNI